MLAVANHLFHGRADLVLLRIDSRRVEHEIRYENLEGGTELYPHLYGPLTLGAVVVSGPFPPDENGRFTAIPAEPVADGSRM